MKLLGTIIDLINKNENRPENSLPDVVTRPVDVLEIQTDLFQTCHLVILGHRMMLNFAIEIFAAILPEQVFSYTL
jgi:hypothetical protein